jgi:hypothetical protein
LFCFGIPNDKLFPEQYKYSTAEDDKDEDEEGIEFLLCGLELSSKGNDLGLGWRLGLSLSAQLELLILGLCICHESIHHRRLPSIIIIFLLPGYPTLKISTSCIADQLIQRVIH